MIQNTSVLAIGVKYLPSMPVSVRIGKKTIRMITTAKVAERTTLPAPEIICSSICFGESVLPRNDLPYMWARIPSTITIEPSTTMPKSMAPRLIRLAETLNKRIRMKAKSMASGMTDATIRPARIFPRKTINTRNTMTAPSTRLRITVEMLRLTSSDRFR